MAAKKRPTRQVWCLVNEYGVAVGVYPTRQTAKAGASRAFSEVTVVGPYVLAERVRQQ